MILILQTLKVNGDKNWNENEFYSLLMEVIFMNDIRIKMVLTKMDINPSLINVSILVCYFKMYGLQI